MSQPVYVIDTNVVVSALITRNPEANVCRMLDGMLKGLFPFLMSPALLSEYRQVLLRPKLKKFHGLPVQELDQILEELVLTAIWHEPVIEAIAPDRGDDHLWQLLAEVPGSILVTGDRLLIDSPPEDSKVIPPSEFSGRVRAGK